MECSQDSRFLVTMNPQMAGLLGLRWDDGNACYYNVRVSDFELHRVRVVRLAFMGKKQYAIYSTESYNEN